MAESESGTDGRKKNKVEDGTEWKREGRNKRTERESGNRSGSGKFFPKGENVKGEHRCTDVFFMQECMRHYRKTRKERGQAKRRSVFL